MENNDEPQVNPYSAPQVSMENEPHEGPELAGRGARLGAAIIDSIILGIVVVVPMVFILGGFSEYVSTINDSVFKWKFIMSVLGFMAFMLINGVFLARDGQSIGKKLVGIKIVRSDGSKADLSVIVLRRMLPVYVAQWVPYAGPLAQFADVLCIFRESRKCLHDDIADTKVVNA